MVLNGKDVLELNGATFNTNAIDAFGYCNLFRLTIWLTCKLAPASKLFHQSQPTLDAHQDLHSKSGNDRRQIAMLLHRSDVAKKH